MHVYTYSHNIREDEPSQDKGAEIWCRGLKSDINTCNILNTDPAQIRQICCNSSSTIVLWTVLSWNLGVWVAYDKLYIYTAL